jgi:SAM-dependent methyltransferase
VPGSSDDRFSPRGAVRSAIYRGLWAASAIFEKTSRACVYLSAGVLRQAELRETIRRRAALFSAPDEHMDAGLEPWEERIYLSVLREGDRVLVVGCGGGRELLALGARGYRVTGIDQVPDLIDSARRHLARRGLTATLVASPVETAALPDIYDVVVFSAFVYGYLPGAASRLATLARLKGHMSPGGRLVASYADGAGASRAGLWLARVAGWMTRSDWRAEAEDTFAPGPAHHRLPFYERRMSADAVRRELAQAGFHLIRDEAVASWRCAVAAVRA